MKFKNNVNNESVSHLVNSLDRRRWLQIAAASGCLASTHALADSVLASSESSGVVDAHVHVWSPDTNKYPLSKNFTEADMQPKSFTPDQLLLHCKANGVKRVVLVQMNFYEFDNSYMTDCIGKHPGVFGGIGIVDHDQKNVVTEMRRLNQLGVRGFRLYADKASVESWAKHDGVQQMWREGRESGQAMCLLSNPDALPGIADLCKQHPKTRVVIDHFSRIGMKDGVSAKQLEQLCALAQLENVYLKTSAFYALGKKAAPYTDLTEMIEKVVQAFGAHRLMWGSDCPYQVEEGHTYKASLELIAKKIPSLTTEDKKWMLGGTAEKLFF